MTAAFGRVTVMGLGRFGGGEGVARWLIAEGAEVLVTDLAQAADLEPGLSRVREAAASRPGALELRLGEHRMEDFERTDLLVVNPAVKRPWSNPYIAGARRCKRAITTEIELVTKRLDRRRVIGVTGTAGKSTTSAMIHHLLRSTGVRASLGGNIGGSMLESIPSIGPDELVVLELSSAMLHSLDASGWSPAIAVLTNLTENHLDWHGTFEHYRHSKETIFRHQRPGDVALRGVEPSTGGSRGDPLPLSIPGAHNQSNARLALAAAAAATGHDPVSLAPALVHFRGLPHRLQLVMSHGERRFYDDSKATTPAATALAVDAFDEPRSVHLIVGGADKDIDLDPLIVQTRRVAGVYTIGATGPSIAERGRRLGTVYECETLETAVRRALKRMGDRDTLLLSPGCASWDQFTNYEQRGTAFERLVRRHTEAAGSSGSASSSPTTDQSCDP